MDRFLKRKGNEVLVESLKKPRKVVRKYDPEYISYGFISAGPDLEPKAQCRVRANLVERGFKTIKASAAPRLKTP